MNHEIFYYLKKNMFKNKFPMFYTGDTITVFFEIKEGNKKRIQSFKGIVIKKQGNKINKTFTIRKISTGIGVERIFILNQPNIKKINIDKKRSKIRKSKIYYIRKLKGKKSNVKI